MLTNGAITVPLLGVAPRVYPESLLPRRCGFYRPGSEAIAQSARCSRWATVNQLNPDGS
ncbi:hypothetical protein [Cylindrospermum stagnale]|uniref:hypothetical protein n=1 Tax=Cylindrospermum stagnale TaxID=142864 RepID=UPI0012F6A777|nr:hypothetical protein [Cylindrospermum stagnale]